MKYLVTGAAGFIGFHVCKKLISSGHIIIGLDNINSYYDIDLKKKRLKKLKHKNFKFYKIDLINKKKISNLLKKENITHVIHLAAQAGVRKSLNQPLLYIENNILAFTNIIDEAYKNKIKHFIYASSSSVYGLNKKKPSQETDNCNSPASFYGATKITNELIAHNYSHNFGLYTTGLRFFTVYGPWGRPDMALFQFTDSIYNNKKISIYNHGNMKRDFTYIDDVVDALFRITKKNINNIKENVNYNVYNIGSGKPILLKNFIKILEATIGIKAKKSFIDMQPGDVVNTFASISKIQKKIIFKPKTSIEKGIKEFVNWYKNYYL